MNNCHLEWGSVAEWAAAIATFLAVVVSLRLARRADGPRMKVFADKRIFIDPGAVPDRSNVNLTEMPEILYLEATNVGVTRVHVIGVGWSWRFIRAVSAHQNPPDVSERSHREWPCKLEHGDQMQWRLPFDPLVTSLAKVMFAKCWWWRLKLKFLRVVVYTSTDDRFRGSLGPGLKKAFIEKTTLLRSSRDRAHSSAGGQGSSQR